ncbi:hypothetical protein LEP1GSC133_4658 [Leptospira borgpetersenii serovar Pomona str. 200901868]|uniref:Uncharacterized protein n=1 Tax=Leptospira borgpetersenii serovar Pomona str. 200901868 TaxID=1192866 RepID=M6W7N4_LEPBO|nr:hypothetical protein LEP1GSC133_4658 [Leptospira borgpetersenii serovar Pomona str. 200901868]
MIDYHDFRDTSIKSRSQNVGTIAAIREDSDKIEWFWDTLKIKKRQDDIKNSYTKLLFLRHSKILKSILQRSPKMIRFSNLAQ